MDVLKIIVASSVVAALVSGLFSIIQIRINYRNEYYKKLIDKRFESYEMIQKILYFFSTSVTDFQDNKLYHIIFSKSNDLKAHEFYNLLTKLSKSNIWISKEIKDELDSLNFFIIENGIDFRNINHGKKYYKVLGDIRNNILVVTKNDLLKLHKIKQVLKIEVNKDMKKIKIPELKR